MPAFGDLLLQYLQRRDLSRVQFAKQVELSDTAIGNAIRKLSAPRFDRAARWVSVLKLSEAEAREFLLEWQLALSPKPVQDLVRHLQARVEQLERKR